MSDSRVSLERFTDAQAPVWSQVLRELRAGRKTSHWMWFMFPQLRGLGHSPIAQFYALASIGEAEAYLREPVLGARLRECTRLVNGIQGRAIGEIFGYPDDLKFRSCMTLFARVAGERPDDRVFRAALEKYFEGQEDPRTLELLTQRGWLPHRPSPCTHDV